MVSGEYDSIGSKCCQLKSTRHDFHSPISSSHKAPRAIRAGEIFFLISDLFYMMKMLEQNVESELEDSTGSMKLRQKGIDVTGGLTPFVTSFVTSHH